MKPRKRTAQAVVEGSGASPPASGDRLVQDRIRQQEILAELGVFALQGPSFADLLDWTARLTAEGLKAEFCKVLEHIPSENRLLVRAGTGWDEGVIGSASVGADIESPAGYALHTGKPVISNHLQGEQRFRTPELLLRYGIRRAMNVILQGDGSPFGVLEVDSTSDGEFSEPDLAFLQGAANVLGMAIERQRTEGRLTAALARQKILLEEINHRVKNSLQLVASMLELQATGAGDPELGRQLALAGSRIAAVSRLYAHLSHEPGEAKVELERYLRDVCRELLESAPGGEIRIDVESGLSFDPERAISIALIVNELVTNAGKHAYAEASGFHVWVDVRRDGKSVRISVRDNGAGLPTGFDVRAGKGLGMRIVSALAGQLGGTFTAINAAPGAEFVVLVPVS